ncbi:MAG: putative subtilase-family protease [Frankiales bacterium]|nr:putative subtilase-family protease [Frankiales bacterium]
MRSSALVALAVPALLLTSAPAYAAVDSSQPSTYVVRLAPAAAPVSSLVRTLTSRYGGQVSFTYTTALRGFAVRMTPGEAQRLRLDPLVAAITPDQVFHTDTTQGGAQYDLDRTDQRSGLDGSYTYNATGAGVHAYDIDTGITPTHTDFGGRASVGFDAMNDGHNGIDCNGHGTHTAGSIGGSVHGMAKQVSLVAVRVLDCNGSGTSAQIIAGVDWVAAHAVHPAVANMSLGSSVGTDSSIDAAVNGLINSGVTVAVAAGNGYGNGLYAQNACSTSPADVPNAITVSATDNTDTKPIWANVGNCVDLFAPGVGVVSDWYTSDTATQSDDGTSMSTPHVAGAAALYLQQNPSATPAQVASFLVGQATTGAVKSPGSGTPNKLLYIGGISAGGPPPANVAPTAAFTISTSNLSATLTDTSTDSDGSIASRSWAFGDGTTGTGSPVTHTYAAAGTYTVTETVTDNGGLTATASHSVAVSAGTSTDPDPSTPTLTSGVAKSGTSGAKGSWQYYKVQVPAAGKSVALSLTGPACGLLSCPADLDLYGRNGAKPTTATYDCASASSAATESCSITGAPAGWTYVGVYVYSGSNAAYTVKATVS